MARKRKDRADGARGPRNARSDAAHDMFLKAFKKPIQLYRYLKQRNRESPIFLHRNLTYIENKPTSNRNKRGVFKVDSLLDWKLKNEVAHIDYNMRITFLGFYDNHNEYKVNQDEVSMETILMHLNRVVPYVENSLGYFNVVLNPNEATETRKVPALTIPAGTFKAESTSNQWVIAFNVQIMPKQLAQASTSDGIKVEPGEDGEEAEEDSKVFIKIYSCECFVFDEKHKCLLKDGEYSISMDEITRDPRIKSTREFAWESNLEDIRHLNPMQFAQNAPVLKFRVLWTKDECDRLVDRPVPLAETKTDQAQRNSDAINNNNGTPAMIGDVQSVERPKVILQFLYGRDGRTQTEIHIDFHCPFCERNCFALYGLLKHMTLCHSRFNCTLLPTADDFRIDISINDQQRNSSTASGNTSRSNRNTKRGPVRRSIVTDVLVNHPKRLPFSVNEFHPREPLETNNYRHAHHNRKYYHNISCTPVHPHEFDNDSESEVDPEWLKKTTVAMIDDFTDVNGGEKNIMTMWNLHVMKYNYIGDCQMPTACEKFVEVHGREILELNLYRNFLLHLISMHDYHLISPDVVYKSMLQLQVLLADFPEGIRVMSEAHSHQVRYWLEKGEQKQKLKQCAKPPATIVKPPVATEASTSKGAVPKTSVRGKRASYAKKTGPKVKTSESQKRPRDHPSTSSTEEPPKRRAYQRAPVPNVNKPNLRKSSLGRRTYHK